LLDDNLTLSLRFEYASSLILDGILPHIETSHQGRLGVDDLIFLNVLETELLGLVGVAVSKNGLLRLRMFQENKETFLQLNKKYREGEYIFSEPETKTVLEQIEAYLNKEIKKFILPIDWTVYTGFQRAVLQETFNIPYGETRSYGEVAAAVGKPKASRAVGQAEKNNQAPLVIPCHRVIGSDGSLTGYGGKGNIDLKAKILAFEQTG
jgi:methylated-DNA-[protein]-cysteine S-methyltransferase